MITSPIAAVIAILLTTASFLDSRERSDPIRILRHVIAFTYVLVSSWIISQIAVSTTAELLAALALVTILSLLGVFAFGYYDWHSSQHMSISFSKRLGMERLVPGDTTSPLSLLIFVVILWTLLANLRPGISTSLGPQASMINGLIVSTFALRASRLGFRYYDEMYAQEERSGFHRRVFFFTTFLFGFAALIALLFVVTQEHQSYDGNPVSWSLDWHRLLAGLLFGIFALASADVYARITNGPTHQRVQQVIVILVLVATALWLWSSLPRNSITTSLSSGASDDLIWLIGAFYIAVAYSLFLTESLLHNVFLIKAVKRTPQQETDIPIRIPSEFREMGDFMTASGVSARIVFPAVFIPILATSVWLFYGLSIAQIDLLEKVVFAFLTFVVLVLEITLVGDVLENQFHGHLHFKESGPNERQLAYSPPWLNIIQDACVFGVLAWITYFAINSFTSVVSNPVEAIQDVKTFLGLGLPVALAYLFKSLLQLGDYHIEDREKRLRDFPSNLGRHSNAAAEAWFARQRGWSQWLSPVLFIYSAWHASEERDIKQSFGQYKGGSRS